MPEKLNVHLGFSLSQWRNCSPKGIRSACCYAGLARGDMVKVEITFLTLLMWLFLSFVLLEGGCFSLFPRFWRYSSVRHKDILFCG